MSFGLIFAIIVVTASIGGLVFLLTNKWFRGKLMATDAGDTFWAREFLLTVLVVISAIVSGYALLFLPEKNLGPGSIVTAALWLAAGYAVGKYSESRGRRKTGLTAPATPKN